MLMFLIPELHTFLLAAETENFSEVARRLGMSQPAVSMQIRSLEQRVDTDLFQRSGRSVHLTEAGEALVHLKVSHQGSGGRGGAAAGAIPSYICTRPSKP